jgi:hypothetical protein
MGEPAWRGAGARPMLLMVGNRIKETIARSP